MRRLIAQTFPAHGVIGEEYGQDRPDAEYVWVLDPIDGTKSFISGLPTWGTLIGLMHNGQPVYGMMSQPFTRERYSGDGKRARCARWRRRAARRRRRNGRPARCARAPARRLREATRDDDEPGADQGRCRPRRLRKVEREARLVRYGGDCYAYCALAAGFVDLVIETNLKPHDIVALAPIVEGAGGVMTTWDGETAGQGRPHHRRRRPDPL